ncbi:ADP/ATP carrier protein [Nowakowskiella sp. JEL0078]|nr:ADP/ATP carrier protein [Nowakowskiella sp. JEL0078]
MLDAFLKILSAEGIVGLYSGLGPGLFGTVATNFSYFYCWSWIRSVYQKKFPNASQSTVVELFLGASAGAMSQFITLPIAVATTRQQTTRNIEKLSFFETMKDIVKEEGLQGLWKGLRASLILCSNPAITYGTFERLKTIWLRRKARLNSKLLTDQISLSSIEVFIIGALSKTLATVITYPYIMAKVKLQWKPPKTLGEKERERMRYNSSLDVLKKVLKSDGFIGWYQGMSAQIVKAVLCQAILFVSKENFAQYTIVLFRLLGDRQRKAANRI